MYVRPPLWFVFRIRLDFSSFAIALVIDRIVVFNSYAKTSFFSSLTEFVSSASDSK